MSLLNNSLACRPHNKCIVDARNGMHCQRAAEHALLALLGMGLALRQLLRCLQLPHDSQWVLRPRALAHNLTCPQRSSQPLQLCRNRTRRMMRRSQHRLGTRRAQGVYA